MWPERNDARPQPESESGWLPPPHVSDNYPAQARNQSLFEANRARSMFNHNHRWFLGQIRSADGCHSSAQSLCSVVSSMHRLHPDAIMTRPESQLAYCPNNYSLCSRLIRSWSALFESSSFAGAKKIESIIFGDALCRSALCSIVIENANRSPSRLTMMMMMMMKMPQKQDDIHPNYYATCSVSSCSSSRLSHNWIGAQRDLISSPRARAEIWRLLATRY